MGLEHREALGEIEIYNSTTGSNSSYGHRWGFLGRGYKRTEGALGVFEIWWPDRGGRVCRWRVNSRVTRPQGQLPQRTFFSTVGPAARRAGMIDPEENSSETSSSW
jgi:hypothetical protein